MGLFGGDWLHPTIGGHDISPMGMQERLTKPITSKLPKTKLFGENVQKAIAHPASFATGGILGGRGGTFETPGISGGTRSNSLVGPEGTKNRQVAAVLAALFGGGFLGGGSATSAGGGLADTSGAALAGGAGSGQGLSATTLGTEGAGTLAGGGLADTSGAALAGGAGSGQGLGAGTTGVPYTAGYTPSISPAAASAGATSTTGGMSAMQKWGLGLSALNLLGSRPHQVNTDPYGTGAAAAKTEKDLIDRYNKGEVRTGDAARISKWEQDQTAATRDYYARAGLSGSSMEQQAIQNIGVQAEGQRQQALGNMMKDAMSISGISSAYVQNMVNQQIQQDQQLQMAQQGFFNMMMQMG